MKKTILLLFLLTPFILLAQTGVGNNTNPVVNPYGTNPYNPTQQNNPNFFDQGDKNNPSDKQNSSQKDNPQGTSSQVMQRQFQDLNSKRSEVDEQKMQEMYKNDPATAPGRAERPKVIP